MTRDQLDAIRARVEAAKTEEGWEPVHTIHKKNYVDDTYTGFQACCPIVFCGEEGDRSADEANELSYAHMDLITNAPTDLRALLAEVEWLTGLLDKATDDHIESQRNGAREAIARKAAEAEVESKVAQNVALVGMNGRLQQEVERLTAERDALVQARESWLADCAKKLRETADDMIAIRKEHERAAFARGVAAMREEAARRCEVSPIHGEKTTTARKYADAVRALPDPEDAP